ncbi:MAG TPA: tail fiber protein [Chthoniobacterales bacterium]
MSEPFIGQLMLVPYNFAPRGWAFCNGQLLSIAQNTALFSLLGTTYGGDGRTTFGLPDLRGRAALSSGQGPGLQNYDLGQVGGTETVSLTVPQIPAHSHLVSATADDPAFPRPTNALLANISPAGYTGSTANTTMAPSMIQPTGGNVPHDNLSPYLTLNYVIALEGIFPSRN